MKKFMTFLIFTFALMIATPVFADTQNVPNNNDGGSYKIFVMGEEPFVKDETSGFSVDILKAIAKDQGFSVECEYSSVPYDSQTPWTRAKIMAGETDAVIGINIQVNDTWSSDFTLSDSYYDASEGVYSGLGILADGWESLRGKDVAVLNVGDYVMGFARTYGFNPIYADLDDYYKKVSSSEMPGFAYSLLFEQRMKANPAETYYLIKGTDSVYASYRLVAHSNKNALINSFNKGLENIKNSGEYDAIRSKYLAKVSYAPIETLSSEDVKPTATPTKKPTVVPTKKQTATPTVKPTPKPTVAPTAKVKATIKVSREKVNYKKKTTVKITSNSGGKITVKRKNSLAKKKKYVKISGAKLTFTKKAAKGKYTFTVTCAKKGKYKKTTKTITIRVKQ